MPNKNPLFMMEEEQKEHVAKLNKMEREMEEVFERKVSQDFYLRRSNYICLDF